MPKTLITNSTIAKAKADARPGGARHDIVDAKAAGLSLRVSPRGVQWSWRFQVSGNDRRLALGGVDLWTVAEARSLVDRGQEMLRGRLGIPDDEWVARMKLAKGKAAEVTLETRPDAKPLELFKWTFADGREAFLADKKRTRSAATHADYKLKLESTELKKLDKIPLPRITLPELARIVASIHASGRERTAELTASILSSMWSWLEEPARIQHSGVVPGTMRGLSAPERTRRPSKRLVADPTLEDLGRVIAITRSGAIDPLIGCAIELVVWSVQRRRAVASAKLEDFRALEGNAEGLWYVFADDRKRDDGEAHVVPLPAPAWAAVQRAIRILTADYHRRLDRDRKALKPEFLFPQTRPRAKGMEVTHIHPSTLTHTMSFMPGVVSSPHRVRSIFGTYGERVLGFARPTTQLILDHSEGGARASVTGKHYALHDGTHEKWPVMRRWAAAVEADVERAIATLEPVDELKAAIAAARYGDDEMLQAAD